MWYVAHIGIVDENRGIRTWSVFKSKADSDEWHKKTMLDGTNRLVTEVYQIIYEGEDEAKAKQACGFIP